MDYTEWTKEKAKAELEVAAAEQMQESLNARSKIKFGLLSQNYVEMTETGIAIQEDVHSDSCGNKGRCFLNIDEAIELQNILNSILPKSP